MTSFLEDKLGEFCEIDIQGESINPGLISLVPCHKAWFEHALSNVTDNVSVHLPTMLLVSFACESPRLHDEWGNFAGSEHQAFLHLGNLHFGKGLCGGWHFGLGDRWCVPAVVMVDGGGRCTFVSG